MHVSIQNYLNILGDRHLSQHTLKAVRCDLNGFVAWWERCYQRNFDPAYLRGSDLQTWRISRQKEAGLAPATINRALVSLRGYCSWTTKLGLCVDNVAVGIKPVLTSPLAPRSLSISAIDALLRASRGTKNKTLRLRDEALLALLIYAGLRVQEACDVQVRDLDLAGGMLIVRSGKAGKARRVPLHPDAGRLLKRYLDTLRCTVALPSIGSQTEQEQLLVRVCAKRTGRPTQPGLNQRDAQRILHRLGQVAARQLRAEAAQANDLARAEVLQLLAQQVAQVTPHLLRHSLAKRMLESGATLPEIQRVLGHTRLETTARYLTPTEADLRAALERAGV